VLRRGDPIAWRRGADSIAVVRVGATTASAGSGGPARTAPDSLVVRFAAGAREALTPSLPEGAWTLATGTRRIKVVVNPSREWVPTVPVVASAGAGADTARDAGGDSAASPPAIAAATGPARPLREASWPLVLALLLLCAEWIGRRAAGLR
jgi:hypothetical protein